MMDFPELSPSSDANSEHAVVGPPHLPSHQDAITTDVNVAYASSIWMQPNVAYSTTNFDAT